jgi:lysophospholipase L1-like esterase
MERRSNRKTLKAIGGTNLVIGALTATLMVAACDDPLYDPQHCSQIPQENGSNQILAIGDSITAFWSKAHFNSCQAYSDYASKEINEHIQNVALGGAELSGSYTKCIPQQYDEAVAATGSYDVVILTGGANDLWNECSVAPHETCSVKCANKLDEIADEMETLVTDIVSDGSDVIIVGYFKTRNGGLAQYNECLEKFSAQSKGLAAKSPRVSFVQTADMVKTIDASNYYPLDEVHPSIKLAQKIGKRVADALR